MLSDRQCDQLRDYVHCRRLAPGQLRNQPLRRKSQAPRGLRPRRSARHQQGRRRHRHEWQCLLRAHRDPTATPQHPILNGFADTNWLPGAQNRIPLKPVQDPLLTVVPGFVRYPPELAYPPVSHTDEPAVVLRESGYSRIAYFSGDIERTYLAHRPRRPAAPAAQHHPLAHAR